VASNGRISVLLSKDLQVLLSAVRQIPREVAAEVRKHTKVAADPLWRDAVQANTGNRLQTRVLTDSARVSVNDSNVLLRSGGVGRMSSGVPKSLLAYGAEFGADPKKMITSHTKAGNSYQRTRGQQFKLPRKAGYVVYPAARESIPRLASLWTQTAVRTIHELLEKGGTR
jgi:hypothetical protein